MIRSVYWNGIKLFYNDENIVDSFWGTYAPHVNKVCEAWDRYNCRWEIQWNYDGKSINWDDPQVAFRL